jgi:hypothetical protein
MQQRRAVRLDERAEAGLVAHWSPHRSVRGVLT